MLICYQIAIVTMQSLACRSSIGLNKRPCPFRLCFLTVCALILTRMYVHLFRAGHMGVLLSVVRPLMLLVPCLSSFLNRFGLIAARCLQLPEQVLYVAAPSTSIEMHMILPWALSILLLQV